MKHRISGKILFFVLTLLIFFHPFYLITLNNTENVSAYPWIAHTIKEGYLILVPLEDDKALYQNYIQERNSEFNVMIFSLEEKKIKNEAKQIRKLIFDAFDQFHFRYLVLDEKIAYGKKNTKKESYNTDFYYLYKDINKTYENGEKNSYEYDFFIGRISHHFLNQKWDKAPFQKALIAMPFDKFSYKNFSSGCINIPVDNAIAGETMKAVLEKQNIKTITMYEKRGSCPSKVDSVFDLNAKNFTQEIPDSTLIYGACTEEPVDRRAIVSSLVPTTYQQLVTAYWKDLDHSMDVDYEHNEISYETYFTFPDNLPPIKRVAFFSTLRKPANLDPFYCSISNNSDFNKTGDGFAGNAFCGVFQLFAIGCPISEAFQCYSGSIGILFGPPETRLSDLVKDPSKHKQTEKYLILTKDEIDKDLFTNYISEREEKYEIKIISLEEKKIDPIPVQVKTFIYETKKEFSFKYLVLFENIPFGKVRRDEDDLISDMYYLMDNTMNEQWYDPLDKGLFLDIFISRISKEFLATSWKPSFNHKVTLALPIEYYPRIWEENVDYIFKQYDYASMGEEELIPFLITQRYQFSTLYEKRGSSVSEHTPTLSLNKENLLKEMNSSSVVFMTTTSEPSYFVDQRRRRTLKQDKTITSAIWKDADGNGYVDKQNKEIEIEELFAFTEKVNKNKRVVFCPMKNNPINPGLFYNILTTSEDLKEKHSSEKDNNGYRLSSVFRNFIYGCSISEAFQLDLASGNRDLKYAFILWGPPETTLYGLFR